MIHPICETCGTQFEACDTAPANCPICEDERQYVGWHGQRWLDMPRLLATKRLRIEEDASLLGIGVEDFAIPQRALLLPTDSGNILWECVSLVTDAAVDALRARGGVDVIAISHPHFYSSMVEWSEALGDVPILLHGADRSWVQRMSRRIEFWEGDRNSLSGDVTLVRCGGHFEGSTALHWGTGPRSGGALFPGDALQVVMDRRHVSFLYSYPNNLPMRSSDVRDMQERLRDFAFEDVYGFTWGRNILGGGRAAVDASFARHLNRVAA